MLAAILLPLLLDVERHRGRIERALQEATGWTAELGEIDISVLHGLALTVSPAKLEAPEGGSRFEVGKIAIRALWGPLFRGRLEIEQIELVEPDITLVRPDIERGWVLPLPGKGPPAEGPAGPAGADTRSSVTIARIDVLDGALRLEDRSTDAPLSLAVENVDVTLHPATGEIHGSGAVAGDSGRVRWSGSSEGVLE
ncbi:MAG: AsmA family protein, partial [Planctomycetota bacterium]